MRLGVEGMVAVVAGASKGIGLATAKALLQEGARVVMAARNRSALEEAVSELPSSDDVLPVVADATDPQDAARVVGVAVSQWQGVDILVSAVGQGIRSTLQDATSGAWEENWRTNVLSAAIMAQAARPHLAASHRGGCIALLGAASGIQPTRGQLVSNVHKAALLGLGKSLALELASEGIRVNVVCPGRVLTERRLARAPGEALHAGVTVEEHLERIAQTIPLGRWGRPEDVADAILFLCSPRAAYITGQVLAVDGGLVRSVYG